MLAARAARFQKLVRSLLRHDRTHYWVAEDTDGSDERVSVRCDGRVLVPVL